MIDFLLSLLRESPILFMVLIANLLIVAYIVTRLSLYFMNKKKPGRIISHFVYRMKAKRESREVKTIDDVYGFVMESLRKEGVVGKEQKTGFAARKNVIAHLEDGEKKEFLKELFDLYEGKTYGNRGIKNEEHVASDMLGRFSGI